ncbi:MAG: hypothetical protein OEY41_12035 [Acidimicrobiia bacterium]|nr:hypothetical protein [Acidimicrobiia bacterium]MDH5290718.1 hypothetical protein [Acidimicrobiia bacterium]
MLNLIEVAVGARVLLNDGTVAEVVENPGDGQWLMIAADGGDELVHAQDVAGLADEE